MVVYETWCKVLYMVLSYMAVYRNNAVYKTDLGRALAVVQAHMPGVPRPD
jgi:hypothetical protein